MAMELEIVPSVSAGPFKLGQPIQDAIQCLHGMLNIVSAVDIKYNDSDPLAHDLLVELPNQGVLLRFDSESQRLRLVELFRPHRVRFRYCGTVFHCPSSSDTASPAVPFDETGGLGVAAPVMPTFVNVYQRFGPSYPGEFSPDCSSYTLNYPGVSFRFPIPPQFREQYRQRRTTGETEHPIEFPDGRSALACRVCVYLGRDAKGAVLPPLPATSRYWESVVVKLSQGLTFTGRNCSISFGASVQDVLSYLGQPGEVFYKEDDKLRIHSTPSPSEGGRGDYFYNYYSLGIDLLFDRSSHAVKKFVLHCNFPNHHDFNMYAKCNFAINVVRTVDGDEVSSWISPDTKWPQVQNALGTTGKPLVNNKGSYESPFGPTYFYGYRDVIFEVLPNGHIASVCLFKVDS
eukprot:m51a1_g5720 hypothetical protein (402) ;mRNA; f:1105486-1107125